MIHPVGWWVGRSSYECLLIVQHSHSLNIFSVGSIAAQWRHPDPRHTRWPYCHWHTTVHIRLSHVFHSNSNVHYKSCCNNSSHELLFKDGIVQVTCNGSFSFGWIWLTHLHSMLPRHPFGESSKLGESCQKRNNHRNHRHTQDSWCCRKLMKCCLMEWKPLLCHLHQS